MKIVLLIICCLLPLVNLSDHFADYQQRQIQSPEIVFTDPLNNEKTQKTPNIPKILYLTPWNKKGYQFAIKYAHKIDIVVLCLFEFFFQAQKMYVQGEKDLKNNFIKQLKQTNNNIKVLQRIYIPNEAKELMSSVGAIQSKLKEGCKAIVSVIGKPQTDGILFESRYSLFYHLPANPSKYDHDNAKIETLIFTFTMILRDMLPPRMLFFYSLLNIYDNISRVKYERLSKLKVDGFIVQSFHKNDYDNAILVGFQFIRNMRFYLQKDGNFYLLLPFFSRRNNVALNTNQIMENFKVYKEPSKMNQKIVYSGIKNGACFMVEAKTHSSYYFPCYHYFNIAFKMAVQHRMGIAFWEGGMGIEKYYEFL